MKRVLITGIHSYIGESFADYVKTKYSSELETVSIDMIDGSWWEKSFAGYDAVLHVAGIAHADVGNVSEERKAEYYRVNRDLAIETANKAKQEGVGQFIFMSSMIVYGNAQYITEDTIPQPSNFYGDSKWQADKGVRELQDQNFKVAVLRLPMIYGKGSKGNYLVLAKLAKKLPVFPKVDNKRSMLYIGNLCEFLYLIIKNEEEGIFFPQNKEVISTSELVRNIARVNNHNIWITPLLKPAVVLGKHMPGRVGGMCRKAFGNSYYDLSMSDHISNYRLSEFKQSISKTEE